MCVFVCVREREREREEERFLKELKEAIKAETRDIERQKMREKGIRR